MSETVIEQHPATGTLTEDHHPAAGLPSKRDLGGVDGLSGCLASALGLSLSSAGGQEIKAAD